MTGRFSKASVILRSVGAIGIVAALSGGATYAALQSQAALVNNTIATPRLMTSISFSPVLTSQIVGRVNVSIPYVGQAIDFLHTVPGLMLLVYIPALGIIIYELQLLIRRLIELKTRDLAPPAKSGRRTARFKSTRMVYTIRSGAQGPRLIRRIVSLSFILLLGGPFAGCIDGAMAHLQGQAVMTGNVIAAIRGADMMLKTMRW